MGGNVRVGMEDSLWIGAGKLAESNAQQVTQVRKILEGLGLEIASPRRGARNPLAQGRRQGRVSDAASARLTQADSDARRSARCDDCHCSARAKSFL